MSHNIELQEGALIISDAHYSSGRPQLLELIKDIDAKKITPPQLILMGDIFDALFLEVPQTQENNQEMIELLQRISQDISVIYLEGNHDFNLAAIFPHARVTPLSAQPLVCSYKDKKVALAHGDFDVGVIYKLYTQLIRNSIVLQLLNYIDRVGNHFILKKLDTFLAKKDDCKEFVGFEEYVKARNLEKYACDYFIEGHYHQNRSFRIKNFTYINLAAFACNQRYFIVKSSEDKKLFLEEKSYQEI